MMAPPSSPSGTSSLPYFTRTFTYQELRRATHDFSEARILGKGGFGTVYRGKIRMGHSPKLQLAIKTLNGSDQGPEQFRAEVQSLGQLRHKNVLHLHGWCPERDQLLLVYEYMPNLSLHHHLQYNSQQVLSWTKRFGIVQGIAAALVYIHTEWKKCILHRDIKPNNVLLDKNMEARLGDFGLARLVEESIGPANGEGMPAGTLGYLAPELAHGKAATVKSDLYSFGVLLLEVACGKRPRTLIGQEYMPLLDWVWQMQEAGTLLNVADPALGEEFNERQLRCVLHVGLLCTLPDPNLRPPTRKVHQMLKEEAPLPPLPMSRPSQDGSYNLYCTTEGTIPSPHMPSLQSST